jgi:hypothetical protein
MDALASDGQLHNVSDLGVGQAADPRVTLAP